jgi:hypothetical protein
MRRRGHRKEGSTLNKVVTCKISSSAAPEVELPGDTPPPPRYEVLRAADSPLVDSFLQQLDLKLEFTKLQGRAWSTSATGTTGQGLEYISHRYYRVGPGVHQPQVLQGRAWSTSATGTTG